jgi:hypothetical protein
MRLRLCLIAGFTWLSLGVPDVPTLQDVMHVKLDSKLCVRILNSTGQVRFPAPHVRESSPPHGRSRQASVLTILKSPGVSHSRHAGRLQRE